MKNWLRILLICAVLLINILIAYQLHFDYEYPTVGDEYVHISFAKYIVDEHKMPFVNPYLNVSETHHNFESGFHFFLAGLFSIISLFGIVPVIFYKYMIIIFMIINSLLVFWFVMLWYRNYFTALISMVFFGSIKSTEGFLSHQYFIPLTLGTTLLLLSMICLYKLIELKSKKYLFLLIASISAMTITYPPALFFFLGVSLLYIIFSDNGLNEVFHIDRKKFLTYFISISIISFVIFILSLIYLGLFNLTIFPVGWNSLQSNLSPIFFFGIIPSLFAAIGLYSIITLKKSKIMSLWFLFSISMIYFFYLFEFTFLVPFQRLFFFYLVGVSILAGIGFSFVTNKINKSHIKNNLKISSILILIFIIGFHYSSTFNLDIEHSKSLDDEKYEALKNLEKEYPDKPVVLSDSITSLAIYPVSGNHVAGIIDSNIGGGNVDEVERFLQGNCEDKKDSVKKIFYNTSGKSHLIVISETKLDECDLMKETYNEGVYFYEIQLSAKLEVTHSNKCKDCEIISQEEYLNFNSLNYDIVLRETNNLVGITIKEVQRCYSVEGTHGRIIVDECSPSPINKISKTYIPPGEEVTIKNVTTIWGPEVLSGEFTNKYIGIDDYGNEIRINKTLLIV